MITAVFAGVAAVVPRGGWNASLGVLGGALLMSVSYWAIKRGVAGLGDVVIPREQRGDTAASGGRGAAPVGAGSVVAAIARYALLAGMAYVMIARLRLHPLALLGGASVVPLAAIVEALRQRP